MNEKNLIFVPYQDSDNFYSDGILTREFAILYELYNHGYHNVLNIKKPRTFLDKKKYNVNYDYYPDGTIEKCVKEILDSAETIQYQPFISIGQVIKRRCWWNEGYQKTIGLLNEPIEDNTLIYSDNPFACDLLRWLKSKGARIFFDVMDNFAIHPSLNEAERSLALKLYEQVFKFADVLSANSHQTCEYMGKYTNKTIHLVKNGVFRENEIKSEVHIQQINQICEAKRYFKNCVGYIGKLGLRLDADLIDQISLGCPNTLFVFVGGYLKGQINKKLIDLFNNRKNIIHINSIPSAYVYAVCNEFDILSIPHARGKSENGGDPLKLYQYLTRNKPIITTNILGVDEFKDYITITDDADGWIEFIQIGSEISKACLNVYKYDWKTRLDPVIRVMNEW